MLLCPECQDSKWLVEGVPHYMTVTCRGYRNVDLCGLTFSLPHGVVFFSTASGKHKSESLPGVG